MSEIEFIPVPEINFSDYNLVSQGSNIRQYQKKGAESILFTGVVVDMPPRQKEVQDIFAFQQRLSEVKYPLFMKCHGYGVENNGGKQCTILMFSKFDETFFEYGKKTQLTKNVLKSVMVLLLKGILNLETNNVTISPDMDAESLTITREKNLKIKLWKVGLLDESHFSSDAQVAAARSSNNLLENTRNNYYKAILYSMGMMLLEGADTVTDNQLKARVKEQANLVFREANFGEKTNLILSVSKLQSKLKLNTTDSLLTILNQMLNYQAQDRDKFIDDIHAWLNQLGQVVLPSMGNPVLPRPELGNRTNSNFEPNVAVVKNAEEEKTDKVVIETETNTIVAQNTASITIHNPPPNSYSYPVKGSMKPKPEAKPIPWDDYLEEMSPFSCVVGTFCGLLFMGMIIIILLVAG